MPITLSGKKYALNKVYALNKQVSNYVILLFFSNNTSIVTFVLTGYGLMLPCMHLMHLALLDYSMPDCARHGQSVARCGQRVARRSHGQSVARHGQGIPKRGQSIARH